MALPDLPSQLDIQKAIRDLEQSGPGGGSNLPGPPGVGVPSGGSTGQVLSKVSSTDYDFEWVEQSGGGGSASFPPGGSTGQVLAKASGANDDVTWVSPQSGPPGSDGAKLLQGAANPANGTGVVGDWYFNTTSWDVFEKTGASAWTNRGNIKGTNGLCFWRSSGSYTSSSTSIPTSTITVPSGRAIQVGDLIVDTNGNIFRVTTAATNNTVTYLQSIKGADSSVAGPPGTSITVVQATNEANALTLSTANPNNVYFWV